MDGDQGRRQIVEGNSSARHKTKNYALLLTAALVIAVGGTAMSAVHALHSVRSAVFIAIVNTYRDSLNSTELMNTWPREGETLGELSTSRHYSAVLMLSAVMTAMVTADFIYNYVCHNKTNPSEQLSDAGVRSIEEQELSREADKGKTEDILGESCEEYLDLGPC